MSPEEIERTVQFLLHQQAQFAADFERLSAKTDRMTDAIVGLTSIVGRNAEDIGRNGEAISRNAEAISRLAAAQDRTDQQLKETGEYIKAVESNLNVVIQMFERHLREDHGHRPS
jgi:prefoldin subunit 5